MASQIQMWRHLRGANRVSTTARVRANYCNMGVTLLWGTSIWSSSHAAYYRCEEVEVPVSTVVFHMMWRDGDDVM